MVTIGGLLGVIFIYWFFLTKKEQDKKEDIKRQDYHS